MEANSKPEEKTEETEITQNPSRRKFIKRIGKSAAVVPVAVGLSLTSRKAWAC